MCVEEGRGSVGYGVDTTVLTSRVRAPASDRYFKITLRYFENKTEGYSHPIYLYSGPIKLERVTY